MVLHVVNTVDLQQTVELVGAEAGTSNRKWTKENGQRFGCDCQTWMLPKRFQFQPNNSEDCAAANLRNVQCFMSCNVRQLPLQSPALKEANEPSD